MTFYNRKLFIFISLFLIICIEITNVSQGIYIPIYGNIFGFILLLILSIKYIINTWRLLFVFFLFFLMYYFLNQNFYANSLEPYKAMFYICVIILFSDEMCNYDYPALIERVYFYYLCFILFLFIFGIGLDSNGFYIRIQGLMSEPSALALILCFLFWTSLKRKENFKLMIVVIIAILTQSLTVYANIVVFYFLLLLNNSNKKIKFIFLALSIYISVLFLSQVKSDNWLVNKASSASIYILTMGDEGSNTRGVNIELLLEEQRQHQLSLIIGNGPYYDVYYYQGKGELTKVKNVLIQIFFDFGLIGLTIFLWFSMRAFILLKGTRYQYLYISSLSYALINSASGINNYIYLFSLIFYAARYSKYIADSNKQKLIIQGRKII